jgi:hypothetical protein
MRKFKAIYKQPANFILIALILIHVAVLSLVSFTAWPEMTFWPYLVLNGLMPYKEIAIAHNPLLIGALSGFFAIFGLGLTALKVFTFILIAAIDLAVFKVASFVGGKRLGLISLAIFIPYQIFYEGSGLWFDLALVLPALLAFYCLKKEKYIGAGVFLATAFFVKQTGAWLVVPFVLSLILLGGEKLPKAALKSILGSLFVAATFLLALFSMGILADYYFWTVEFGIFTLPFAIGQVSVPGFNTVFLSLLPFVLAPLAFSSRKRGGFELLVWGVFGMAGAYPRFELFHYQPGIPFLVILIALAIVNFWKDQSKTKKIAAVAIQTGIILAMVLSIYKTAGKPDMFWNEEFLQKAERVRLVIGHSKKVLFLNTWDTIYIYTDNFPVGDFWVPHLSWYMELPGIQERIIGAMREEKNRYAVVRKFDQTGLGSYKPVKILSFLNEHYETIEIVDDFIIYQIKNQ